MLTPVQSAVSRHLGNAEVIAIPGSGKTHTLIELASNLIAAERRLVMVTFTRQAAQEMRERLDAKVGKTKLATIATMHSLAINQIRLSGDSTPILPPDEYQLFLMRAYDAKVPITKVKFSDFAMYVDRRESGLPVERCPRKDRGYRLFKRLVRENQVITLNGVIPYAKEIMAKSGSNFYLADNLLIDEFQDSDPYQVEWALQFVNTDTSPHLTVVGDDDQAIYGFRGSNGYQAFLNVREKLDMQRFVLDTNFRSHSEIVSLASNLIGYNTERVQKTFRAHKGSGGKVEILEVQGTQDQLERILEKIRELPKPLAVMTRNRDHLKEISRFLRDLNVEHIFDSGNSVFGQPHCLILLGLLSSLLKTNMPAITNALTFIGIPEDQVSQAVNNINGHLVIDTDKIQSALRPPAVKLKQYLASACLYVKSEPSKSIEMAFGWLTSYTGLGSDEIEELNICKSILSNKFNGPLLQRLRIAQTKMPPKQCGVELTTMHSSKGRQFETVIIPYANDKICPLEKEGEVVNYPEELRLFYVAITRAIKHLHILYPTVNNKRRSPFLDMMKRPKPSQTSA